MKFEDVGISRYDEPCEGLKVGIRDNVAVVLFDRPQAGNSFNTEIVRHIGPMWQQLDVDPKVHCIVLASTTERFFCTGIDVTEVAETQNAGQDLPWGRGPFLTTRHVHVFTPLVCAVEGLTVGGGLHFVVDADIVVAGESSKFLDTHVNLGLVGAIENIGLALKAGLGTALYLTLTGRSVHLDASKAERMGLVQEVVPDGMAGQRAFELAQAIAANSPSAVTRSLEAVWSLANMGYEDALRFGKSMVRRQRDHPDWLEGPRAFAEKRAPQWSEE